MPRPRRNSSRPSSRRARSARSTVFVLTPSTAARSLAGGSRSPGFASPSAIARRSSAAACSCSRVGSRRSILTRNMVLCIVAQSRQSVVTVLSPPRPPTRDDPRTAEERRREQEALIKEARERARRRRERWTALVLLALLLAVATGPTHGSGAHFWGTSGAAGPAGATRG